MQREAAGCVGAQGHDGSIRRSGHVSWQSRRLPPARQLRARRRRPRIPPWPHKASLRPPYVHQRIPAGTPVPLGPVEKRFPNDVPNDEPRGSLHGHPSAADCSAPAPLCRTAAVALASPHTQTCIPVNTCTRLCLLATLLGSLVDLPSLFCGCGISFKLLSSPALCLPQYLLVASRPMM